MQFISFSMIYLFIFLLLPGCSFFSLKRTEERANLVSSKALPSNPRPQKSKPTVVLELLGLPKISLNFKNVDTGSVMFLNIQNDVLIQEVNEGHWELTGFIESGKSFTSLETSKKFVFHAGPKTHIYVGSVVMGCPTVSNDDFKLLKNMKFFNRYPFSSENGICELVIGNDKIGVEKKLQKILNSKNLSLVIGF